MQQIDDTELKEFLAKIASSIKETIENNPVIIKEPVEVEISIAKVKTAQGGVAIKIVEAGGNYQAHETSKIKMKIEPNYNVIRPMSGEKESPCIVPKRERYA